jgi:cell division protein FtsI/penicillin-binding protein 2
MIQLRRFGAPMGVLILALVILVVRLYEVQVTEHGIWAREALGLVRSSRILPARRGRILDRQDRVIVEDRQDYVLEFVWRDFRREHPLGAIAQARSQLLGRPVSLAEADANFMPWALELVALTPADLAGFARGGGVPLTSGTIPALGRDEEEREELARMNWRRTRAGDAGFYLQSLLGQTRRESYLLRKKDRETWDGVEFLTRTARVRPALSALAPPEARMEFLEEWVVEIAAARERLIDLSVVLASKPMERSECYRELLERLESIRREVENAVADDLFANATGFSAARLATGYLDQLDLEWLGRALVWDQLRLREWTAERGARVDQENGEEAAGFRLLAGLVYSRLQVARENNPGRGVADRVLDELLRPFVSGGIDTAVDWRTVNSVVPLDGLVAALGYSEDRPLLEWAPFPFQLPVARDFQVPEDFTAATKPGTGQVIWGEQHELLSRVLGLADGPQSPGRTGALIALGGRRREEWSPGELEPIEFLLNRLDQRIQHRVGNILASSEVQGASSGSTLALAPKRVAEALEPRDHLLKDQSLRPRRLLKRPPYSLVEAVTRFSQQHAGFVVSVRHERHWREFDSGLVRALGQDLDLEPAPLFQRLIGSLRSPSMVRVLRERDDLARARELQAALKRNQEDLTELVNLFGANLHAAQKIGGSGIEGYFDLELRGSHGYSESIGLTEREAGPTGHWSQNPIDGEDLILTLDVDLQRVAQDVLERPLQLSDPKADPDWWQDPVGALVLARVDGQVLAAASVPSRPQVDIGFVGQGRRSDDQRLLHRVQRTMRMPTFQPPGSTIKPLIALWAMEYGWLDEAGTRHLLEPSESLVTCLREGRTQASGYGKVRCSSTYGHSYTLHNQAPGSGRIPDLCLTDALPHSCNAFFSWLGQHLSPQDHRDLADRFGLGTPTGVRTFEGLGETSPLPRVGLVEDRRPRRFLDPRDLQSSAFRQYAGNGLVCIQATPLQMARAYAGVATGNLPTMAFVSQARGISMLRPPMPLGFKAKNLAVVGDLMEQVVSRGSASGKGLSSESLGFRVACKTGSADIGKGPVPDGSGGWEEGMRKHTWVAGWFPVEQPEYVFVLLVHDTSATSSHGAVQLASQFLKRPEVRALIGR